MRQRPAIVIAAAVMAAASAGWMWAGAASAHPQAAVWTSARTSSDRQRASVPAPARAVAAGAAQRVSVFVPRLVAPRSVTIVGGRIKVPLLLTDPASTAVARVEGTACSVRLQPARVTWLDCPVRNGRARLVVVDDDGEVLLRHAAGPADK